MRTLFLTNSLDEARQALDTYDSKQDTIIALSLEAEFYLKSKIESYRNPQYKFLDLTGPVNNYNFLLPNFKAAYDFAKREGLDGVRDRLGYFFSEFDRSMRFASKVIGDLKPKKIVLGNLKDYPGSSVINGSLKTHAFYVISKEKNIAVEFLSQKAERKSLRRILGEISNKIISFKKLPLRGSYDLVILAPPRHILQLENVIRDLKKSGIKIFILTYTLTPTLRNRVDKSIGKYFEKEKFITNEIELESKKITHKIIGLNPWIRISHPKYRSKSTAINFLKNKIKHVVQTEFLENMRDKCVANKFVDQVLFKALLTTTDPDSKVMHFINAARGKGIKTIALQHGVMWSPAPPSVLPLSDKFIVWSNISKQWIRKIDGANNIDIVVGQSPFHKISKHQLSKKKGLLRILFLATIVILDVNMIAYYQKRLFEVFAQFAKPFDLTVRVHPFQDTTNLNALIKNSKINASFDKNENLSDSIDDSDLVIFEETTAGFDAMLAGKPTIFFNPYSQEDYFEAKKRDYAMTILCQKDIDDKLLKYIKESHKWRYYAKRGNLFAQKFLGIYSASPDKLDNVIAAQLRKNDLSE